MQTAIDRVTDSLFAALRPPPKIPMSEFAEKHIRLDETVSATAGRLRLYPYQRQMLDAIQEPDIERVTWLKSSQLGMTTLLDVLAAHYVANDPSTLLCAVTRDSDARRAALRVEKTFNASPYLAGLLRYVRNDTENRSTLLDRQFPGGNLRFAGVQSPDNLRSVTAKILLADEVSGWSDNTEGDPVGLVEMRTSSYRDRKLVFCSTPTTEASCKITGLYEQSDKREWRVQCQHCSGRWFLTLEHLQWESGKPETVVAVCPDCGGIHTDQEHKLAMIEGGRWVSTAPEIIGHAGFKINSLSSLLPTATWPSIVKQFLAAKGDDFMLQSFTNTVLGETWKENFELAADPTSLEARAEGFDADTAPNNCLLVTAGADVQRDRIEITFLGFAEDGIMVLDHVVLWGDPNGSDGAIWQELDKELKRTFTRVDGKRLKITAACVDAGDGVTTEAVRKFCGPRWNKGVYAIKGMAGFHRPPFEMRRQTKSKHGGRLGLVGTEAIKSMIFGSIRNADKWRFSDTLDPEWFDQLVSERLEIRKRRGVEIKTFVPISGKRQEALDCCVYAIAARYSLQRLNFEKLKADLANQKKDSPSRQSIADISSQLAGLNS